EVKDEIPLGTTFIDGSVKIGGEERREITADSLREGIEVELQAHESKNVEFKVTVNDLDNGTIIENTATVNGTPTNTTENTYTEAIINATKEVETENSLAYVVEGEKITYTIVVENSGDLGQDVLVKDSIPAGTTFIEGSIKVN